MQQQETVSAHEQASEAIAAAATARAERQEAVEELSMAIARAEHGNKTTAALTADNLVLIMQKRTNEVKFKELQDVNAKLKAALQGKHDEWLELAQTELTTAHASAASRAVAAEAQVNWLFSLDVERQELYNDLQLYSCEPHSSVGYVESINMSLVIHELVLFRPKNLELSWKKRRKLQKRKLLP